MAKAIGLDGKEITSIYGILTEFSEKFEFPNYFSFNFNALDKMLEDLWWFPRSSHIGVIQNGYYFFEMKARSWNGFYLL